MMLDQLHVIEKEATEKIQACQDLKTLNDLRFLYLGKKGPIQEVMKKMKELDKEERAKVGQVSNQVKQEITKLIESKKEVLEQKAIEDQIASETIDISLPAYQLPTGTIHPLSRVIEELEDLFIGMGYDIAEGPEVEEDYYNFELLNVPKGHPARDMQDTLYIDENKMLRSQT